MTADSVSATLCFGALVLATRRNKKFTELLFPIMAVPMHSFIFMAYYTDVFQSSTTMRNMAHTTALIQYLLGAHFMNVDYVPHFIIRQVIYYTHGCMQFYTLIQHDEFTVE